MFFDTTGYLLCWQRTTGVLRAAEQGDFITVRKILEKDSTVSVNSENLQGKSLLYFAVAYDNNLEIAYLLARGANVNVLTCAKVSPLHLAVQHQNREGVDLLCQFGAAKKPEDIGLKIAMQPIDPNLCIVETLCRYGSSLYQTEKDGQSLLIQLILLYEKKT